MRPTSTSDLRTSPGGREGADDLVGSTSLPNELPAGRRRAAVPWRVLRSRGAIVLASTLLFFALWQTVTWILSSSYLPGPAGVLRALAEALPKRDFIGFTMGGHIVSSLRRVL